MPGEFVSDALQLRHVRWLVLAAMLSLAIPTGLVALLQGAGVFKLPFNLFIVDQRLPGIFRLHMLASGLAMALIPLAIALRHTRGWHRPIGRLAAVCVVAGALTSLPVALMSESVAMARAGFLAQGIVWLGLLTTGVQAIRRHDLGHHQRCMLAMAGVASGAIWVRLTTTAATAWDLPFDALYGTAAWAGWIIPMIAAWKYGPRLLQQHRPARA